MGSFDQALVYHQTVQITRGVMYTGYFEIGEVVFSYNVTFLFPLTDFEKTELLVNSTKDAREAYMIQVTCNAELLTLDDDEYELFSEVVILCAIDHFQMEESDGSFDLPAESSLADIIVFEGEFEFNLEEGEYEILAERFGCRIVRPLLN